MKKIFLLLLTAFLLCCSQVYANVQFFTLCGLETKSGWGNSIKLTIDKDKIDTANLTDFPVLIHLSTASGIGNADNSCVFDELGVSDTNRKKIAVTTSNGVTELYVEIERWGSNSTKNEFAPHNMTTNSLPSPYVTSASTEQGGFNAFKVFDGNLGGNQYWLPTGDTGWLKLDLGEGNATSLGSYAVVVNTIPEPNRAPKDWTLEGSNNDSDWNILDTQTNQTGWSSGESREYTLSSASDIYRYFKLNVSDNNGDVYLQVGELYLYEPAVISGEAWLHVKVPVVTYDEDTVLYLYYDANHTDNDTYVGDTTDAITHNVWNSNFIGIWHMAQDPNGDEADAIKESTVNENDGTPTGSMTTADLVDAQVGKGIDFDHSDDAIICGNISGITTYTYESIIYLDTATEGEIFGWGDWGYLDFQITSGRMSQIVSGGTEVVATSDTAVTLEEFIYVAAIYTPATGAYTFFLNGSPDGSGTNIKSILNTAESFHLGNVNGQNFFDGVLDELRVSDTIRSASWIKATYHSLFDSLITFGDYHTDVFYPVVSGDDGYSAKNYGNINTDFNYFNFGDTADRDIRGFVRFPNVTIPQGSTITEAYIQLHTTDSYGSAHPNIRIYCNDVGNSVAPTTEEECTALVTTTAYSDWNIVDDWLNNTEYNTPSIITSIQEIVDSGTWSSGNALTVIFDNNSSASNNAVGGGTVDYSSGIRKPELHIKWVE